MLPTPGFHHLHLNSVDPEAAIDFYTGLFPSTTKGSWGGIAALQSPNNVLVLFDKVAAPPPTSPQSAIWHFGWHVRDSQAAVAAFKERPEVTMRPLYTTDEGGSVLISSDTWPSIGNTLGLTRAQIAEARAKGVQPTRKGGFAYMSGGPEDALFEIAGDYPAGALQPRASVARTAVLRAVVVQEAPQRAGAAGFPRHRAERGQLPGRARRRAHLAGAQPRGDVPHAARRGRVRRCRADLVHEPGRPSRSPAAAARCRTISD